MDWERFSFEYQLNDRNLFRDLVSIEAYKEASLNLVFPQEWQHQLDRLNRVRAVHGTTAIEGNPLSEAEVAQQMERLEQQNYDDKGKTPTKEQLQIRNAGAAQSWVKKRFLPDGRPVDLQDILTMHEMITQDSDTHNNIPGELRSFSVKVGTEDLGGVHRGAPHEQLPRLMEEYIDFINSRQFDDVHPVIRALLAHFFLVTIHPFGDGNGRVSRLVEQASSFSWINSMASTGYPTTSNATQRNTNSPTTMPEKASLSTLTPRLLLRRGGFARELKDINNSQDEDQSAGIPDNGPCVQ